MKRRVFAPPTPPGFPAAGTGAGHAAPQRWHVQCTTGASMRAIGQSIPARMKATDARFRHLADLRLTIGAPAPVNG